MESKRWICGEKMREKVKRKIKIMEIKAPWVKCKAFLLGKVKSRKVAILQIPQYLTIFLNKCDISLIYNRVRVYCHVLAGKFVGKFTKLHVNRYNCIQK